MIKSYIINNYKTLLWTKCTKQRLFKGKAECYVECGGALWEESFKTKSTPAPLYSDFKNPPLISDLGVKKISLILIFLCSSFSEQVKAKNVD